jgi:mannose-6-phosphate isomerase
MMRELKPFSIEKPWGWFRQFIKNEASTVKILFIKRGEAFSLQKHQKRDEFWRVLSGNPDITIGDEVANAKAGDEFEILPEMNHRISARSDDVEVLEISRGDFDEEDIVRLEDKYGRT